MWLGLLVSGEWREGFMTVVHSSIWVDKGMWGRAVVRRRRVGVVVRGCVR